MLRGNYVLILLGFMLGIRDEHGKIMQRFKEVMAEAGNVKKCCGNCWLFNGDYCTKDWNNADEDYCVPERDSHEPEDKACDDWDFNPMWSPEDDE